MRSIIIFILQLIKVLAIIGAVLSLIGIIVTASRDNDQKRYLLDVAIDGE